MENLIIKAMNDLETLLGKCIHETKYAGLEDLFWNTHDDENPPQSYILNELNKAIDNLKAV